MKLIYNIIVKTTNIELLPFLLGSFKEQKELITQSLFSSEDLNYIWDCVTKLPFATDSSGVLGYTLHQSLLKQPLLTTKIVNNLWFLYKDEVKINLKPEIVGHPSFDISEGIKLSETYIKEESFNSLSWILKNPNPLISDAIARVISDNEALIEKWKYLKHLKRNTLSATQDVDSCLKLIVLKTSNKQFLNKFYFWLQKENFIATDWLYSFLENPASNLKVLKNIFSHKKSLREDKLILILSHPNASEELLDEAVNYFKSSNNKNSTVFNGFLKALSLKEFSASSLNKIFNHFLFESSALKLVLEQKNFKPEWVWQLYLNASLFSSIPKENQDLLKKYLKI